MPGLAAGGGLRANDAHPLIGGVFYAQLLQLLPDDRWVVQLSTACARCLRSLRTEREEIIECFARWQDWLIADAQERILEEGYRIHREQEEDEAIGYYWLGGNGWPDSDSS